MKNRNWKRMTATALIATMTVTGATYAWADEYKSVSVADVKEVTETPKVDPTDVENDNLYEETAPSTEDLIAVYQERIVKLNELIAMIEDEEITALLTQAIERFEAKINDLTTDEEETEEEPTEGEEPVVEEPVEEEPPVIEEPVEDDTELEMKKEQLAFKIAILTKVYDQVGSDQARAAIQKISRNSKRNLMH